VKEAGLIPEEKVRLGITGGAGPDTLEGHPVGQVFIAIAGPDEVKGFEIRTPPRRIVIKRRAANTALTELRKMITGLVGVGPFAMSEEG